MQPSLPPLKDELVIRSVRPRARFPRLVPNITLLLLETVHALSPPPFLSRTTMSAATETQPLLQDVSPSSGAGSPSPSPTLVAAALGECGDFNDDEGITSVDPSLGFHPSGDPDNPRDWPDAFKWGIVMLLAAMAFTVTFTCISIVPLAAHIVEELDGLSGNSRSSPSSSGSTATVLLVTIWELGEAAGPLAIAPLSETASWGRYGVLNAATLLFVGATTAAAMATSTSLFIAARGLTGLAVATNVLGPAIIGDLFPPSQRGSAMAIVQMAPLMGGAVGPAIGGAVAETWGWRSVLWLSAVLASTCAVLFLVAFRETYPPAVLQRRRLRLEKTGGKTAAGLESGGGLMTTTLLLGPASGTALSSASSLRHMRDAVLRPAVVLSDSIVLAVLSLFGAVVFSYFYIMSVSLPHILEVRYGLSSAATGSAFLAFSESVLVFCFLLSACSPSHNHFRFWCRHKCHGLQPVTRPHLPVPGEEERQSQPARPARVPAANNDRVRLFAAGGGGQLWMVRGAAPAAAADAGNGGAAGHEPIAVLYPAGVLCGGCVWAVCSIGNDGPDRDALSLRDVPAADSGAARGRLGLRLGLHGAGVIESDPGAAAVAGDAVRRAMAAAVRVHAECVGYERTKIEERRNHVLQRHRMTLKAVSGALEERK